MNDTTSDEYFELTHMIERLHRRQLDVLRGELNRLGIRDVSPAQAMLLTNIEGDDILYRELVDRGYYLGSNAAYNVKKLVGAGYLDQERASHDRRAVKLQLSEKGRELCAKLNEIQKAAAEAFAADADAASGMAQACDVLRRLERSWAELLGFRRY